MKKKKTIIKLVLSQLLTFFAIIGIAQTSADPATGQIDIRNLSNESLNANQLVQTLPLKIVIPVYNLSQVNAIPVGTCQLKINIGANLKMDPDFNLNETSLKNYFKFTISALGSSTIITGALIAPLPNDFASNLEFRLLPKNIGQSEISVNFELNKQNPANTITDEDPQNNFASLQYIIVKEVFPVKFIKLTLSKTNCNIGVLFQVENEVDVNRYEIESSVDGIHFQLAASTKAIKATTYNTSFSASNISNVSTVFVRVKSIDFNGLILYSEVKTIAGLCKENNSSIKSFPNPVSGGNAITIKNTNGIHFNGIYHLTLFDVDGTLVQRKELNLKNAIQFTFQPNQTLAKGCYFISIYEIQKTQTTVLAVQLL